MGVTSVHCLLSIHDAARIKHSVCVDPCVVAGAGQEPDKHRRQQAWDQFHPVSPRNEPEARRALWMPPASWGSRPAAPPTDGAGVCHAREQRAGGETGAPALALKEEHHPDPDDDQERPRPAGDGGDGFQNTRDRRRSVCRRVTGPEGDGEGHDPRGRDPGALRELVQGASYPGSNQMRPSG